MHFRALPPNGVQDSESADSAFRSARRRTGRAVGRSNVRARQRSPQCGGDRVFGRRHHHEVACVELRARRPAVMAASAFAQQGTTEVKGKVVDAQSAARAGATVVARNQATGMFRETVSGADGTYFVGGLIAWRLRDHRRAAGIQEAGPAATSASRSARRRRSICSSPSAAIEEVVSVSAESPLVDVTTKEVGGNITGGELVDLPSINRNFIGFIGLLPGIVPSISTESFGSDSISVNGSDPRSNNYMLDGGNNNDDVIGQRAGTQARTAIESVQEFQVITNQFDAQFGRTTGAIINAVTKSGTNNFHGSAFAFGQDADWTAKDYFAKERNLQQAGHQAPRVRRHDRRSDRQGQGALLLQPRARDDRSRRGDRHPGAARSELEPDDAGSRVEHDGQVRSAGERQPHLGRALASRVVAAAEPGDHASAHHVGRDPRGRRQGPDGRRARSRRSSAARS